MRVEVKIIGQVRASRILRDAISPSGSPEPINDRHGYRIPFNTRREAQRALWRASRRIRAQHPGGIGLRYNPGSSLLFDTGLARIERVLTTKNR